MKDAPHGGAAIAGSHVGCRSATVKKGLIMKRFINALFYLRIAISIIVIPVIFCLGWITLFELFGIIDIPIMIKSNPVGILLLFIGESLGVYIAFKACESSVRKKIEKEIECEKTAIASIER
jgi:hypothetical protein